MDHLRKVKQHEKRKTYNDCCEIAVNALTKRSYDEGYHDGYDKAVDRMITAIGTMFTVIGTVVALVGVVLRALYKERFTDKNKNSIRCKAGNGAIFYHSF